MSTFFSYKDEMLSISHAIDPNPQQSQFPMHTHSGAEVYLFQGGKGVFHVEGAEYVLEPGDVVVFGPSESHYIDLDIAVPYERTTVHLNPGVLNELDSTGELLRPIVDRKPGQGNLYRSGQFEGRSERYWQIMRSPTGDPHTNVVAGLVGLLQEIYVLYTSREAETAQTDTVEYRIIRYINKNLSQPIALDDICAEFYISKPQLCRRFKKATGTSVSHYITVKRLVEARNRLRAGEHPVRVGSNLGFGDYSSFYRAYRKHYGCSPGQIE